jgi:Cu-Zn family superoxide dismutase
MEKAIAVLYPTKDNSASGVVTFTKLTEGIKVTSYITGLTPGKHGFHIHEFGDCSSDDGSSAGGHFNPTQMAHGAPTDTQRHSGDFGNITADSTGTAVSEWIDPMITFVGPNSIIGRAVIVHASEDDLRTQPTGAAGARIACGVIGVDDNK